MTDREEPVMTHGNLAQLILRETLEQYSLHEMRWEYEMVRLNTLES